MKNWFGQELKLVRSSWYLWLFPLFAVALSSWLFWGYYQERGPMIRISFEDASGIQPEKTQVRFRGVRVGTVENVTISEDTKDAIVEVRLRKEAENFAVEGSKFSLILPKVDFQGISGLETLFEGTYITVLPGSPNGELKTDFKAQATIASTENMDETTPYVLETPDGESINSGDLVSYRGLKIGSVTKVNLSKNGQRVLVQINVEHRYRRLIRTNTVFWKKAGVHAKLGLFNSELTINSMETILHGGIDLQTPDEAGAIAKAWTHFYLEQTPPKEAEKWNPTLARGR